MKPFIYLSLAAMLLTGTASMQAQNKTKAKTQEGAKKFKLEDSLWKLSYPYNIRRE